MKRGIFQAIADPTRRAIIVLIASHAMAPNALADKFMATRQAVSKHIRILQECDVVESQKNGREIYYRIKATRMKEIDDWLSQFRQLWEDQFNQLDDVLTQLKTTENEK